LVVVASVVEHSRSARVVAAAVLVSWRHHPAKASEVAAVPEGTWNYQPAEVSEVAPPLFFFALCVVSASKGHHLHLPEALFDQSG
jgi:hypothetical protein